MLIAAAAVRLGTELGEQEGGNVTKVPPPASALRAPPRNAAAVKTTTVIRDPING
jgi:hypothetical protein